MAAIGTKLRSADGGHLLFWCPGCDGMHMVRTGSHGWGWNGCGDRPTFSPSVLVNGHRRMTDAEHARAMAGETIDLPATVCHSFVTAGRIQFLGDCTHALAGQTVDLPDFDQASSYAV